MRKILNFGSLNLDYVYSVDRIVTQGETISSNTMNIFCGGKGLNQSCAAARAGAEVYHAGMYGADDGKMLMDALNMANVKTQYVKALDGPSGHAIIQVDSKGQNCIIICGGANVKLTEEYADEVLDNFGNGDILLLQNEINQIPYIMKKARERGMKIAFNPSPINEKIAQYPLELVDIFILNEVEGAELSGESEPEKICDKLLQRFPNAEIVLTLGKNGCIYCSRDIRITQKAFAVKAVDTTAAGDTFTGYYLAAAVLGFDHKKALERASAASAIAVTKNGACNSIPDKGQVDNFLGNC